MGILNYLPTFKVVEPNRLTAPIAGHILSQYKADATITLKVVNGVNFLENGLIVGLNKDLTIGNFDATEHAQPFLVFVEEINTFMAGLKYYATEEDADGEIYPRALGLFVGDTFTTDHFVGTGTGGAYNKEAFAKVVNGVLTLQAAADVDTLFAVEESTLPLGDQAVRVTYIGAPAV